MPDTGTFQAAVLAWLKEDQNIVATDVVRVSGDGTDWNGGTEEGFFSSFGVTIQYIDGNSIKQWKEVTGDDMESLWTWVVSRWPDA